jgi:FYVE zinc finger
VAQANTQYENLPDVDGDGKLVTDSSEWVEDDSSNNCLLCNAPFTMTKRRHHCRRCGMLVCGKCSTKKFRHYANGVKMHRVCDGCFNQLRFSDSEPPKPPRNLSNPDLDTNGLRQLDAKFGNSMDDQYDNVHDHTHSQSGAAATENSNQHQHGIVASHKRNNSSGASQYSSLMELQAKANRNQQTATRAEEHAQQLHSESTDFAKLAHQLKEKQ